MEYDDSHKFIIFLHDDKPIVNDKPAGSVLMFSIIGYKLLLSNGIPENNIFFCKMPEYKNRKHHYFMFDDFSYSGSQLKQNLNQLYVRLLLDKTAKINLNVILCGVTTESEKVILDVFLTKKTFDRLKEIHPERLKRVRTIYHFRKQKDDGFPFNMMTGKLPFKLYYGILVESFESLNKKDKLRLEYDGKEYTSKQIYDGLHYFFRPYNQRKIPCCIYFSHKRADYASTMAEILQYSPIIPINFQFNLRRLII